jgi:hypothetical protein
MEGAVSVHRNLAWVSDNSGLILGIDLRSLKPMWVFDATDDSDIALVVDLDESDKIPYLYTACEVDKQGPGGKTFLRRINGLTGREMWNKPYPCHTVYGPPAVNGGTLATPVLGKYNSADIVVFTVARNPSLTGGIMVALDRKTGNEVWKLTMPNYSWSSPVDVYDPDGNMYLLQADSGGIIWLIDGKTGKVINKLATGSLIEASPAVYGTKMVIGTRGTRILGIEILCSKPPH